MRSALPPAGRVLLAAWFASMTGCAYTVRLLSDPVGARVTLPDGSAVVTPAEARFPWTPRDPQSVYVEFPGYRTLMVEMQRTEGPLLRLWGGALFQRGGREVTFVLEPLAPLVGGAEDDLR